MKRRDVVLGALAATTAGMANAQSVGTVKCVIVGNAMTGKTCALTAYAQNKFSVAYVPSMMGNVTVDVTWNSLPLRLGLWDTPGSEDYDRLRPLSYPQTQVFIVAFAMNSASSFDNVRIKWIPEILDHNPQARILLAGLKVDLREASAPSISRVAIENMVSETPTLGYRECSARTRAGLTDLFAAASEIGVSGALGTAIRFQRPQLQPTLRRDN